jgi:diaminohydroxyphosphoribosylaminopyrimidine deaminase/5-amino-6-(5-phosphoribosylamino)uracil reductase
MTAPLDSRFMSRALALAARGHGTTHPNPMVGAVIVQGEKVVGEGWHRRPGEPHAEILAIERATGHTRGATLYVNLEPCAHHGRTGPCAEAVIQAGIGKVVVSTEDPHPLVAGKGIHRLREAGVETVVGEGQEKAAELNRAFFHYVQTGTPYVTLKLASTLDGRIAWSDGTSKWITGEKARASVHRMRSGSDAILVGVGTVIADDPRLTVRSTARSTGRSIVRKVQPHRIVLDPALRTPGESILVKGAADGRTVLVAADDLPGGRYEEMEKLGVRILKTPVVRGRFKWDDLAGKLVDLGVLHLMVEGGSETAAWFIKEDAVNRLELFYAPRFMGSEGIPSVGELGLTNLADSLALSPEWLLRSCRRIGDDLRVTADSVKR